MSLFTPEEEAVIEWQYGQHRMSDFKAALWKLITLSDDGNLDQLEKAFPVIVRGYKSYTRDIEWWPRVEGLYLKYKKAKELRNDC